MKFVIQVSEILSKDIIVEANNAEDAERIALCGYRNGHVTVDKKNLLNVVVECRRVAKNGDLKYHEKLNK